MSIAGRRTPLSERLLCREVLERSVGWHGLGEKGPGARKVLANRRGSQSTRVKQMTPVRIEKRREPVAVGLDHQ